MKTRLSIPTLIISFFVIFLSGCGKDGQPGRDGQDGLNGLDAEIYYSPWITPTAWNGQTGDWYFDVSSTAINASIVERGIMLAYISLPDDIYPAAVRSLPAYAQGCNWDFLVPDYGSIEFLCDALNTPGTTNYLFRFILIPGNIPLKSTGEITYTADELKKMSYLEVCKKFGIPE